MDFNLGGQLHAGRGTFSLALERVSEAFSMILAAYLRLVAVCTNS